MIGSSQRNDHLWNRTHMVIDSPVGEYFDKSCRHEVQYAIMFLREDTTPIGDILSLQKSSRMIVRSTICNTTTFASIHAFQTQEMKRYGLGAYATSGDCGGQLGSPHPTGAASQVLGTTRTSASTKVLSRSKSGRRCRKCGGSAGTKV